MPTKSRRSAPRRSAPSPRLRRRASAAPAPAPVPTLEEERTILKELAEREEGAEYELGVHYNTLVDAKLWRQGPYQSAADFVAKEIAAISRAEISLFGLVARRFSAESARRYGMSKLGSLLAYAAAAKLELPQGDPGNAKVIVPRKRGGGTVTKKFADCTRAELRAATRRARGADDGGEMPPEDAREVRSLRNTFINAVGQESPARFQATFRNGSTLVSLENLPVHEVWMICQALGHPPRPPPPADD